MEHRIYKRAEVIVDVAIYRCGEFTTQGKVRNLSQDGMFIECQSTTCPVHVYIEIAVAAHKRKVIDEQRVPAYE